MKQRIHVLSFVALLLGSIGLLAQTTPTIKTQPASTAAMVDSSPVLRVEATGTSPLRYQWYFFDSAIAGATENQLRLPGVQPTQAGDYKVVVSYPNGRVTSATAVLTVFEKPALVKQPVEVICFPGEPAVFSVEGRGSPDPFYQWMFNNTPIRGANGPEYSIPITTERHVGKYKVVLANPFDEVTSQEVELKVLAPPVIVAQPKDLDVVSYSLDAVDGNEDVDLTVAAIGAELQYQWYRDGKIIPRAANDSADKNTLHIRKARPADVGTYSVLVWNKHGQVVSAGAQVSVLAITAHPRGALLTPGASLHLEVTAFGRDCHYQWTRNGESISGANQRTLALSNVGSADGGTYAVTVFNDRSAVTSDDAIVRVNCPLLPFQDSFARRGLITAASGTGWANNAAATRESREPLHAGKAGGRSLWLTWVAPMNGIVLFDTVGSDFDTVVAAYTGTKVDSLAEVASDDESGGYHSSHLMIDARAGVRYQIAVDSLGQETAGNVVLTWKLYPSSCPLPEGVVPLEDLTVRAGDPVSLSFLSAPFEGSCPLTLQWLQNGRPVAGGNQARLDIPSAGVADVGTYSISITSPEWQYFSEAMELQINTEGVQAGARNRLPEAKLVSLVGTGTLDSLSAVQTRSVASVQALGLPLPAVSGYSGSQVFATSPGKDPEEPSACGVAGGASYWFSYQPPADGTLFLNTDGSGFDTVLGVYRDDGRNLGYASLIPLACDNNSGANQLTSALQLPVSAGTYCYIMVDGVNGAYGLTYLNYVLDTLPGITAIPAQSIYEDQSTSVLSFTISDLETSTASLTLAGTSSDTTLVPSANIVFGGSGAARTVRVTPSLYRHGVCTITIAVTDAAGGSRSTSFSLTVLDINHAPQAYADSVARLPNRPITIAHAALLRNDVDRDGDVLTLPATAARSYYNATITRDSTFVTYTPPVGFNGTDWFTYTARDPSGATATGTVYVSVSMNGQTVVY